MDLFFTGDSVISSKLYVLVKGGELSKDKKKILDEDSKNKNTGSVSRTILAYSSLFLDSWTIFFG